MNRQQMDTSDSNGVDHISGLSEPIIHSIFSLLSPDDLRNIPLWSKHFNSVWTSFPFIYFHLPNDNLHFYSSPNIRKLDNFLAQVQRSIQLRNLNTVLKKFSLRFNSYHITSDPRIDEIIQFALHNNVQDLDLLIGDHRLIKTPNANYRLIEGFNSTSLTDLNLTCIHFDIDSLISSCPSLKSLIVTNCSVSETEYLRNITSYVCLRELELSGVKNSYKWIEECVPKAVNLVSLKVSCLGNLTEFRVTNQKLEYLELSLISFEDGSRFVQVVAPNLRSLCLGNIYLTDKWLKDLVSSLQNLENLKIRGSRELRCVEIFSDSIRSLELVDCDYAVEVAVNANKLSSFIYRGRVIDFTLMNTSRVFNSTLELKGGIEIDDTGADEEVDAWNRLREFLSFFSHCETLTLVCSSSKDFIIPEYIKAGRHPPLYGLKHLKIKHHKSEDKEFATKLNFRILKDIKIDPKLLDKKSKDIKIVPELIDNFLWLSPHLESLSFAQGSEKEKIIKLYYDSEKEASEEDCCRGLPFRCWRDDFIDIELKNFDATDNQDQLWKYFDESAILSGNSLPSFARSIRDRG